MSDPSAISDNAGTQILDMIRPAVPSLEKLTPTARLKHPKAHEPSPASTLGDSATEGSDPATPQDGRVRGQSDPNFFWLPVPSRKLAMLIPLYTWTRNLS